MRKARRRDCRSDSPRLVEMPIKSDLVGPCPVPETDGPSGWVFDTPGSGRRERIETKDVADLRTSRSNQHVKVKGMDNRTYQTVGTFGARDVDATAASAGIVRAGIHGEIGRAAGLADSTQQIELCSAAAL